MSKLTDVARANVALGFSAFLISFLSTVLVVRVLGPVLYADYASLLAMISLGLLLAEAGGNTGFMRYLPEAGRLGSRGILYVTLLHRRWGVALIVVVLLIICGPLWVQWSGLSPDSWNRTVFLMVGLVVAAGLSGQLANYGLLGTFHHRSALAITQIINFAKASFVVMAALWVPTVTVLALVLAVLAVVEAAWFHGRLWPLIRHECNALPADMSRNSQRHGFVTAFDKITSAVGNGPFLLLALAAFHSRFDLALLAVAADMVQKTLFLAGLPAGNMILPYLNQASGHNGAFVDATRKVVKISAFLFLFGVGAVYVFIPSGLPLLFGESFAASSSIALVIALPLFLESWARFALLSALTTLRRYRQVIGINAVQAMLALAALALTYDRELVIVVIGQGLVKIVATGLLMWTARRYALFSMALIPSTLVATAVGAAAAGVALQYWLAGEVLGRWTFVFGLAAYAVLFFLGMRLFAGFDSEIMNLLRKIARPHDRLVDAIFTSK